MRAPARGAVIVAALAVSQTVGYGALYYAFSVLLLPMARDLRLSTATVTGALTAATLASALSAVPVGRRLDRHGGRLLMSTGSAAGTLLLVAASAVDGPVALYAVWTGIGLVCGAVLYEAAFPVVVSWYPDPRRRSSALLVVTVVAGFASSIFLPLTGHLVAAFGWRHALLVLAVVHGCLTVPLHACIRAPAQRSPKPEGPAPAGVRAVLRDRGFWGLALAFVASGAAVSVLAVHLVAYLEELGHGATTAAWAAGGLGVLSVSGRLITTAAQGRRPLARVVCLVFTLQAVGLVGLVLVGSTLVGAAVCVVLVGLGFGVGTIARPALLADRFGTSGFATLTAAMAIPLTVVKAVAPLAAAWAHDAAGSYTGAAFGLAACCCLAAFLVTRPGRVRDPANRSDEVRRNGSAVPG